MRAIFLAAFLLFFISCAGTEPEKPSSNPIATETVAITVSATAPLAETPTETSVPSATPTTLPSATPVPTQTPSQTAMPTSASTLAPTGTPTALPRSKGNATTDAPWELLTPDSRDQAWLAAATLPNIGTPYPASNEKISAGNLDRLSELAIWGKGSLEQAVYGPNGKKLYGTSAGGLYIYDADSVNQIAYQPLIHTVSALAISPDGQSLALGFETTPALIAIYSTDTLEPVVALAYEGAEAPYQLSFSTDGTRLVALGEWVQAWETTDYRSLLSSSYPLPDGTGEALGALYAADKDRFIFVYESGLQSWAWDESGREYRFDQFVQWGESPESLTTNYGDLVFGLSPDGRWLALADSWIEFVSVIDTESGEIAFEFLALQKEDEVRHPHKPPQAVVSAGYLAPQLTGPGRYTIDQLLFSADSSMLAVASDSLDIDVWDVAAQEQIILLDDVGRRAIFRPDGEVIASLNHHLSQWQLPDGSFKNVTRQHFGAIHAIEFIPNRESIAIGGRGGYVYLREVGDGSLISSLKAYNRNEKWMIDPTVYGIEVSASGRRIVVAGSDLLQVWDIENFSVNKLGNGTDAPFGPTAFAWSGDENIIAVGGYDSGVSFYALRPTADMTPDLLCSSPAAYTPGTAMLFDCKSSICGFMSSASVITLSPAHPFTLACDTEYGFTLWESWDRSSTPTQTFEKLGFMLALTYSQDGSYLVGISEKGDQIWLYLFTEDEAGLSLTNEIRLDADLNRYDRFEVAISPDNALVAVSSYSGAVQMYDTQSGELVKIIEPHFQPNTVSFSVNGERLAIGTRDGTVHFWGIE